MRIASLPLVSFLAASAAVGVACAPGKDPAPDDLFAHVDPVVAVTAAPKKAIQETFVEAATRFFPGAPAAFRVEVDRVTGRLASEPIEGAFVAVRLMQKGQAVATLLDTTTDQTGGVEKSVPFPAVPDGSYDLVVETKSEAGKETQQTAVTVSRRTKLLLVTDKPIYQPGQVIHLRALALHDFDLTPATGAEVEVSVEDGKGNRVFKKRLTAGEFGQVSTDMTLADEVNEGDWHIKAAVPAPPTGGEEVDAEKSVSVKHYVLPKFKLSLDGGKGFFKPGETVHGKVEAGYFFGKPVAGGEVVITASTFDVEMHAFQELHGTTDADGRFSFDLALPTSFVGQPLQNGDALLKLDLAVKDKAEHTERITRSFPVAPAGFRVDLIPESGTLVPGVENRIYAVTTTPDGAPLGKVKVSIAAGSHAAEAVSDEAGIASIAFTPEESDFLAANGAVAPVAPRWRGRAFPAVNAQAEGAKRSLTVKLSAEGPGGETLSREETISAGGAGPALLLRVDRAIYRGGATAKVDLFSAKLKGAAYLDLVKQGQTLLTRTVEIERGHGRLELPLSADFAGTLELHAYVVPPSGEIVRDTKVVYVEPASDLTVTVSADRSVYKPGQEAKLAFQVADKHGKGVPAAIAAIVVDESVYALQESQPGLEKVYFTLEKELAQPRYEIHYSPESVASLVERPPKEAERVRQEAAQVLLAKAEDVYGGSWIANPRATRIAAERQNGWAAWYALENLISNEGTLEGKRSLFTGRWDWAGNPVEAALKKGYLQKSQTVDAWGKELTPADLEELGFPAAFDDVAALLTAQRIQQSWGLLYNYAAQHPQEVGGSGNLWQADLWKIPSDALQVEAGKQGNDWWSKNLKDGWGRSLRVITVDHDLTNPLWGYRQLRRTEVVSAGPDGIFGTEDDVTGSSLAQIAFWRDKLDEDGALDDAKLEGGGMAFGGAVLAMKAARGDMAIPAAAPVPAQNAALPMRSVEAETKDKQGVETASGSERREAKVERVREYFPETLLWEPSLLTDEHGKAELSVPMADSITTWRLTCSANSKGGQLGSCGAGLKVFQDFFVDLDLPVALTRGDEVSLPVAVYNYLKEPQSVRLVLEDADWMSRLSEKEQRIDIGPGEVGVRWFRIRADRVGDKKLMVSAYGPKMSDAVRKDITVVPDGTPVELTKADRLGGEISWSFDVPENAIPDASRAFVKLYPGMFSQVVEGVDGILRLPGG